MPSLKLNEWVVVDGWRVERGSESVLRVLIVPLFVLS